MAKESKPSFCISASMLTQVGAASGMGASPSRYCTTWRMPGRASGKGCAHASPSRMASRASSASYLPHIRGSSVSSAAPLRSCSCTQSSSTLWSSGAAHPSGRRPQATSSTNTPKANTSVPGVAFPVRTSSGARYPMVPTTCVVCGSTPWSYSRARPKSPSRPFMSPSRSTLLGLMSRWITTLSQSSWRYSRPDATPLMIWNLCSHPSTGLLVLVQAAVGHVVVHQQQLPLAPAVAQQLHQVPVPEVADADHLRDELLHPLLRVVRHPLHGDLQAGLGLGEHALVHPPEAAGAEQLPVLEPPGGVVQLLVREAVGAELHLPVLAHLGVPQPPPHVQEGGDEQREDERRGGDREHDLQRLGPGLGPEPRQRRQPGGVQRRGRRAAHGEAPAQDVVAREDDTRGRGEADVGGLPRPAHRREVDRRGDERLPGPADGQAQRRHGDVDPRGGAVVVDPDLHGLAADEAEVVENPRGVVVVAGAVVTQRAHAVHVDAQVVAVHVLELRVEHGVQLHEEDAVVVAAVVGDVEDAQVLARVEGGELGGRRHHERHAVVAQHGEVGHDGEDEGRREGPDGATGGVAQADGRRVERVAGHLARPVAQHQEPVRRHHGHAVEGEVGAAEAVVGELVGGERGPMVRADGRAEEEEEEREEEHARATHRVVQHSLLRMRVSGRRTRTRGNWIEIE
ncbi:LOW QUALITY PROTEIN: hypothetical protein U9M48_033286 [Paspalum notatum var. saurae]|uniref:Uncharacterized protein n=1 Tax=Paspalum notatum var. saurae TaxID=547442 RepID=A0AAQ3U7X4_PASNO